MVTDIWPVVTQVGRGATWVRHAGFDVLLTLTERGTVDSTVCVTIIRVLHVPTVIRQQGNRLTVGDSHKQWCFTCHRCWAPANTDNETALQRRNKCQADSDFTAAQPWRLFTQCATPVNTTSHQDSHATFTLPSSVGRNAFRPQKSVAPVQSVNSAGPLSFFTPINQRQSTEDSNEQWYSSSNSNLNNRRQTVILLIIAHSNADIIQ